MPRPPKFQHPLRKIRAIAGLTQIELARLVGVSKETIEKVENDKLSISERLGLKLQLMLGCIVSRHRDKKGRVVFTVEPKLPISGAPYTSSHFQAHSKRFGSLGEPVSVIFPDGAAKATSLIFMAAMKAGKFAALRVEFEQFAMKALGDHQLRDFLEKTLESEGYSRKKAEEILLRMECSPLEAGLDALPDEAGLEFLNHSQFLPPKQNISSKFKKGQDGGKTTFQRNKKPKDPLL